MLPAEGRQVLQEIFIDGLAMVLDRLDCPFQIDGVPEHDSQPHESAAASLIKSAIGAHIPKYDCALFVPLLMFLLWLFRET